MKLIKVGMVLLLVLVTAGMATARVTTPDQYTDNNTVVLDLTSSGGVLVDSNGQKTAVAYLQGTADNNYVKLRGKIMVEGKEYPVTLEGKATKVFIGCDVPKDAKPTKINLNGRTRIVYEGARKMYAVLLDLKGDGFKLGGEFFEDGHGGLVGIALIDGKKHEIGLRGNSAGLFEKVSLGETLEAKSSYELNVPYRSQWELFYEGYGYEVARRACGEASAAMLEEYWTGHHPDLWDIWVWSGYDEMNNSEAEAYLQSHGAACVSSHKTGTLNEVIDFVKYSIDHSAWPMMLEELSRWGNLHAVVIKGYTDSLMDKLFKLNDPNSWTGTDRMYWYHDTWPPFNFEDNAYKNVGADDHWDNGIAFVY